MAGKISDNLDEMAEINVTPLVDVMLVLLIIFIITAPMLVQGLNVNLPKQDAPSIASRERRTPGADPQRRSASSISRTSRSTSSCSATASGPPSPDSLDRSMSRPTRSCPTAS